MNDEEIRRNDEEVRRFACYAKAGFTGGAIGGLLPLIAMGVVFLASPPTRFMPAVPTIGPREIAVFGCILGCPCMVALGFLLGLVGTRLMSPLLAPVIGALIAAIVVAVLWYIFPIGEFFGPPHPWLLVCVSAGGALVAALGALRSPEKKQTSIGNVVSCLLPAAILVGYLFRLYSTLHK
jgi:hypothetical protein